MMDKHSEERRRGLPKGGLPGPFDGFAAATAVGFAMTAQALDMWFGVMSGVAKASKNMLEPQLGTKSGEPASYAASEKPATVKAKSATRTVVADIERSAQDVAEVAIELLGGKTKELVEDRQAATPTAKAGDVIAFEAKPAAPKRAKVAKPVKQKALPVKATEVVAGLESRPIESVTVESSSTESGLLEGVSNPPAEQGSNESVAGVATTAAGGPSAAMQAATSEPVAARPAVAAIMPEDFRQPKAIEKPEQPDDLKLIMGVGPKLEKVLNGLGIWTFAQVAGWSREEVAWVDDYLSLSGRIARDGWAAQAEGLAKGLKAAG